MSERYTGNGTVNGPHIRNEWTSQWKMKQVLIALLFPTTGAVYFFGWYSLVMITTSIITCVLLETLVQKATKQPVTINDLTAVITGWLLALTLPTSAPLWTVVIGDFIAIVLVKHLGGGLGRNWINPAVAARVLLKLFLSPWITNWIAPGPDVVTTVTPLVALGHFSREVSVTTPEWWKLFLGIDLGGPMGETSKLLLLIAGGYLILRKIINPLVPLLTLSAFYLAILIYSQFNFVFATAHLLSGALIMASVFMVTDYTTSPMTDKGKYYFAIGCGVVCAILRIVLDLPGGIGVAIVVMNLAVPFIDQWTMYRVYGEKRLKITTIIDNK
ncbi:RnfABCDGE type electron transport complex subunit D [Enterococcus sp. DIV1298c]|uniref:RnfABCDGE type electron transport complex subunit D n=1 Tax=Enterococcus sp. DIV1298c TaxID=2815328 RepID=UPI001A9309A7|nr:RnfABCDGE type electron transport complex subunit D [Enterococcus sp. DIV1298c]MBO0461369.1 RnfABCDGE type electron transport complex subunit D [Enterococcus sp. DIV1298c]